MTINNLIGYIFCLNKILIQGFVIEVIEIQNYYFKYNLILKGRTNEIFF